MTRLILVIDLDKCKSVACIYDRESGEGHGGNSTANGSPMDEAVAAMNVSRCICQGAPTTATHQLGNHCCSPSRTTTRTRFTLAIWGVFFFGLCVEID
jgi:hypothetical protein